MAQLYFSRINRANRKNRGYVSNQRARSRDCDFSNMIVRHSVDDFDTKMEMLKSQLNFQHSSIVNHIVYNPKNGKDGGRGADDGGDPKDKYNHLRLSSFQLSMEDEQPNGGGEARDGWTPRTN